MVTGGYTGSDSLDTTETLASNQDTWATAATLPRPMYGLIAATIDDRILIFGNYTLSILYLSHTRYHRNIIFAGGYTSDANLILEYDPEEDSMVTVGQMTQTRGYHAVSVVQAQDFSVWCK